jgi:nicotinamide-nucleotide amidase
MRFDLIVIGNELLNGKIQDINTHFLASSLTKAGHELGKVQIIQDSPREFKQALQSSIENSDIILTSGGLGPTPDDLTKNMLASYFNKKIIYSEEAFKVTTQHYDLAGREYNTEKIDYHNIPEDFFPLRNPTGYAPGLGYKFKSKRIYSLPGVPLEFQSMFTEEILPTIPSQENIIKHFIIKTWKIPEAKIFQELCPSLWADLEYFGEVSSLPHVLGVDIGVRIKAHSENEIESKQKKIITLLNECALKDYIWHIGPELIEEVIVKEADSKNIKIGFAESCTGGLCASRITDISGSSSIFWGSIISYANEVKIKSLNVSEQTLTSFGAVSEQTALEMAIGAREHLNVDIAVTTTGIAGPGGGSTDKPVGTVGIGISSKNGSSSRIYNFSGNREMLKMRFSQIALMSLLEEIRLY